MKNKTVSKIYLAASALNFLYFLFSAIKDPPYLDRIPFIVIWAAFGIFFAIYGIKVSKREKDSKYRLNPFFASVFGLAFLVSLFCLLLIINPSKAENEGEADYIILLGGGVNKDFKLSENSLLRVKKAAEYAEGHPSALIIPTGKNEAPYMKDELLAEGIDENRIITEEEALDTIQNLTYSLELIKQSSGCSGQDALKKNIVIVTSFSHLGRSEYLASRLGFTNVSGLYSPIKWYDWPNVYAREIGSYIKLFMRIVLTRKPAPLY